MLSLAWSHLLLVFVAARRQHALGGRPRHLRHPARPGPNSCRLSRAIVNIGQTFPPVAVLALAVPVVGLWRDRRR